MEERTRKACEWVLSYLAAAAEESGSLDPDEVVRLRDRLAAGLRAAPAESATAGVFAAAEDLRRRDRLVGDNERLTQACRAFIAVIDDLDAGQDDLAYAVALARAALNPPAAP